MAFGQEGYLSISKQNTWGTSTNSWHYIPIESESMTHNIALLASNVIQQRYDEPSPHQGIQTFDGDISTEINPIDMGHFLKGVFGVSSAVAAQSGYVNTHTFTPVQSRFDGNAALTPYTCNVYRGVDEAFQITDCQFNTMEINVAANGIAKMRVGVIGRVNSLIAATTASYHTSGAEYTWDTASVSISNTAVTDFENITVNLDNKLEGISFLDGTHYHSKVLRNGFREVRVSGTIDLPNLDEYDAFVAQSERQLIMTLTGTQVRSGYYEYLKVDIPKFRYETFPINISGPNRLSVGFAGRAVYHTGSLTSIKITAQNTFMVSY